MPNALGPLTPTHLRHTRIVSIALGLLVARALAAQDTPRAAGDDLLGLWGAEAMQGPQVRGELLLDRAQRRWTMRVAGFEATGDQQGDSVVIRLAGGQGTLRAWVGGPVPIGFWVQPEGMNAPYATPLRFRATSATAWRADVLPLEERFPMYLSVTRAPDGALHGVFRNPEFNWPGRAGWYRIERDRDSVAFIVGRTGKLQWRQPYDSAQRAIAFDFGGPVVLHPRDREQVVGLVPRSPSLAPYEYRAPVNLGDGWHVAAARTVGMDEGALRTIVRDIVNADPLDDNLPRIHSLLVARRGRLVLDEYFMGYSADQLHDLRSASKTMTSIMAGVAMQRGARFDMSTHLGTTPITVGQLLTHTSGLACDDDDDASPGNEDTMQSQHVQDDWYQFFLALPRVHPPGTTYAYCSAGVNMVGSVIRDAVHSWLPLYFDRYLAQPLAITHYGINLMPTGEAYSAGGMHMRPRDFMKFGQLYLDGGRWNGTRLVSAGWVRQSTARQVDRPDGSEDGFGWHRHLLRAGARSFQTYEASGNGGQFLVVIPDLQLVIVATAGNYGQYAAWRQIREQLVPRVMSAAR